MENFSNEILGILVTHIRSNVGCNELAGLIAPSVISLITHLVV